jgi:hypothetical protein
MSVHVQFDFEGAFGLAPYGLPYNHVTKDALHESLINVVEILSTNSIKASFACVGLLFDETERAKHNIIKALEICKNNKLICDQLKCQYRLLERRDFQLSSDVLHFLSKNNYVLVSHTYFHIDYSLCDPSLTSELSQFDLECMKKIPLISTRYIVFPANRVPGKLPDVFDFNVVRSGSFICEFNGNYVIDSRPLCFLGFRSSKDSLVYSQLKNYFRNMSFKYLIFSKSSFILYSHIHNFISDNGLYSTFNDRLIAISKLKNN